MPAEKKFKILIIDDDVDTIETLKDIFDEEGYDASGTTAAKDALKMLDKIHPDIVLVDIRLPDMDGISLIHSLREKHEDCIYMVITGNASLDNAIEAVSNGVDAYFLKPFDITKILLRINKSLEKLLLKRKLKESEEKFRTLAEQSLMGIIIVQDGTVSYMNQAAKECFKYKIKTFSNIDFSNIMSSFYHADQDLLNIEMDKILSSNAQRKFRQVCRLIRENNEIMWIDLLLYKINFRGKMAVALAFLDATEKIKAEQELEKLNKTLEKKVEERTRELEEANKAKSIFLANVSHELRTPLNSIIGFSESLLEEIGGELNEDQKEFAQYIFESGLHLLELINQVLDLTKIESGKMKLSYSKINIQKFIEKIRVLFKEKAKKHRILIETKVDQTCDFMHADLAKLKQIFINLIQNAIKFTPDGGKIIIQVEKKNDEIQFMILDTGIGIKKKDLPRLFKPFEQLETSLERKVEGTGLGLYYTKKLLELHGGNIQIESNVGKGTSVIFTIPIRKDLST
ncbi:MAG: ATP-binding protein [Promethearchaeota archaeon]